MLGSKGAGVICRPRSGTGPRRPEAAMRPSTRTVSTISPTGMRNREPGVPGASSGLGVRGRRAGRMPPRRPRVRTYLVTPGAPLPGPALRVSGLGPAEPWPPGLPYPGAAIGRQRYALCDGPAHGDPQARPLDPGRPPGGHASCFASDSQRTPASPSWGPDGTLVLDQLTSDRPAVSHRIRTVRPERPDRDIGPAFAIEGGDFRANLAAVRGEYALAILCSVASGTAIAYLGCDEAVLVELPTARSAAVLAPGRSSDNRGFFFAGWVP